MRTVGFLLVMSVLAWPARVLADGKVFSAATATAKATIPNQQALIHFADDVERLVIETRFSGSGTDFAWVVPLPAIPEVSEVTRGLFPTLQSLFQPTVIHNIAPYYLLTICLFIAAAALLLRRYHWLILLLAILVLAAFVLPSLGTAGTASPTGPAAADSIVLHNREIIGDFEVATVSADRPDAMTTWLDENGYGTDEASETVIADYVHKGWVFAAVKLHRPEDTTRPTTPHPLAFTFATDTPVYPLRLTGINNGPCRIDLYVFGPDRAAIPGFAVTECWRAHFSDADAFEGRDHVDWVKHARSIVHPQLRTLVQDAAVATKLSATLTPEQMTHDGFIAWAPFTHAHRTFFSRSGAARIALNIGLALLCLGMLASLAGNRSQPQRRQRVCRRIGLASLVTLVSAGATYAVLPTVHVRVSTFPWSFNRNAHISIASVLEDDPQQAPIGTLDERALADRVAHLLETHELFKDRIPTNPMTGQRILCEDSPGNYGFRITDTGAEYLWYDRIGAEHSIPLRFIAEPDTSPPSDTQPASSPER